MRFDIKSIEIKTYVRLQRYLTDNEAHHFRVVLATLQPMRNNNTLFEVEPEPVVQKAASRGAEARYID